MLINPSVHIDWVQPHSIQWYAQLAKQEGVYRYPWSSSVDEPNGESVFTKEVSRMVRGSTVLDIGCGHGEFTISLSLLVNNIIGFDVTEDFFPHDQIPENVIFVAGNSKEKLPFQKDLFDCAFNRKGPTSAYPDLLRVVKDGGKVIGLHPGDELCKELPEWFPGFFEPISKFKPILLNLEERLSSYRDVDIQLVTTKEYLHSPLDVIRMRTFGQKESIYIKCLMSLPIITDIFERHTTDRGLPVTHSYYLVKATV